MTTGGNNVTTTNRNPSVFTEGGTSAPLDAHFNRTLVVQGEVLDVQLHTQAKLQAQGRVPTATPSNVRPTTGGGDRGDVAEVGPTQRTSLDRVRDTICAYPWPQGCEYWIGVAWCESSLGQNLRAYSSLTYTGLFQIWSGHGYGWEWLQNDANNTLAAWELSSGGMNVRPWPYCAS